MIDDTMMRETNPYDWDEGEDAFPPEGECLTGDRRTEARLCAVQALFSMIVQEKDDYTKVKVDFADRVKKAKADKKLFDLIIDEAVGLPGNHDRYKEMVSAQLLEGWTLERVDPVLRSLLWAAAAEMAANDKVGPKVVLNEFLNIAKGFAKPDEVAFINAALDRMARLIRPMDF